MPYFVNYFGKNLFQQRMKTVHPHIETQRTIMEYQPQISPYQNFKKNNNEWNQQGILLFARGVITNDRAVTIDHNNNWQFEK